MINNSKTWLMTGLAAVAGVVVGVALMNGNETSGQEQEAAVAGDSLIGKPMPDIRLSDMDGNAYPMEGLRGKNVVLFFNEGLMCYPACWNQMVSFGADARFNSADTAAISVVTDAPQDWRRAVAQVPDLAKAVILFDAGAATSRQLGILSMGSSMHPGQLPGHTYILIDKKGIVREIFDDQNMGDNSEAILRKIAKF